MSTNKKELLITLQKYDLSAKEAELYLYLLEYGSETSVVKLSRELNIGRTLIYNTLDKLENKGLVKRVLSQVGYNYRASTPEQLKRSWQQKKDEVIALEKDLDSLVNSLQGLNMPSSYKSQVEYFTGTRGLEQITYNSLKAQNDLFIYEMANNMSFWIDQKTAEVFRSRLVENKITTHQLTNHQSFTNFTRIQKMVTDFWDIRYIDPKILSIEFEMIIYNDVCALYSYKENEPFGVEIHNHNLAHMQKQIFTAMQRLAVPMVKQNNFGQALLRSKC